MKKIFLSIILIIMFFPVIVLGKSNVTIRTNVSVEGKNLEDGDFSFVLKDKEGKILQTKKNNISGEVVFDSIEVDDVDEETNYIYFIGEVNSRKKGYTYDDNIVYVRVNAKPGEEAKVFYYKNNSIEEEMNREIPKYEPKESYHATEEELRGDAYAVFDAEKETLYFRRIENLDTSGFDYPFDSPRSGDPNQAIDGNIVYLRNVETDKIRFQNALSICHSIQRVNKCPKRIIFEDAFKPTFTDGSELFQSSNSYAEEFDFSHFDSSNITDMSRMFSSSKVKVLDLSSFETSQVTNMSNMFLNSLVEEIDLTSFKAKSLENIECMFENCQNLKTLKISNQFQTNKLKKANSAFSYTPNLHLLDLSWLIADENTNLQSIFHTSGLKYVDLSHLTIENGSGLNSIFATSFPNMNHLVYVDLSGMTSPSCGAWGSSDFNFLDQLKVLKISHQYNTRHMMNSRNILLYNVENKEFTNELSNIQYQCNYYMGGEYLNIQDESGSFMNSYRYVPDSIIDNIITNPVTGQSLLGLSIVLIGFITYSAVMFSRRNNKGKR